MRFRKAEMVLFGGARETRWATCQNLVIVSKTKKSLRCPCFSRSLWYIIFSTLIFLKMILNKKESLKIMKTGPRAALPFLIFNLKKRKFILYISYLARRIYGRYLWEKNIILVKFKAFNHQTSCFEIFITIWFLKRVRNDKNT